MMRFWVYDDEGVLFRKFHERHDAEKFVQPGWKLVPKPKEKEVKPNEDTHGRALW